MDTVFTLDLKKREIA